jgi:hypothetical protein
MIVVIRSVNRGRNKMFAELTIGKIATRPAKT